MMSDITSLTVLQERKAKTTLFPHTLGEILTNMKELISIALTYEVVALSLALLQFPAQHLK